MFQDLHEDSAAKELRLLITERSQKDYKKAGHRECQWRVQKKVTANQGM